MCALPELNSDYSLPRCPHAQIYTERGENHNDNLSTHIHLWTQCCSEQAPEDHPKGDEGDVACFSSRLVLGSLVSFVQAPRYVALLRAAFFRSLMDELETTLSFGVATPKQMGQLVSVRAWNLQNDQITSMFAVLTTCQSAHTNVHSLIIFFFNIRLMHARKRAPTTPNAHLRPHAHVQLFAQQTRTAFGSPPPVRVLFISAHCQRH